MTMYRFAKVPANTARVRAQRLRQGSDVPALKALFGLTIAKGLFEETKPDLPDDVRGAFPASASNLQDYSGLGRAKTLASVRQLVDAGFFSVIASQKAPGVDRRTRWYRFCDDGAQFAAFPYGHWRDTNAMDGFREGTAAASAALRLYLLLASFRQNASGVSWLSYDRAATLGIGRNLVRPAYGRLQALGLLAVGPSGGDREANRYVILGLDSRPTRLSATRWSEHGESDHSE